MTQIGSIFSTTRWVDIFLGVKGQMLNNLTYTHTDMKIYVKCKKKCHRSSEKNVSYQGAGKQHAVGKGKTHHYVLSHMEIHMRSSVILMCTGKDIGINNALGI